MTSAMAILIASLSALRAEFNTIAPSRDKSSDGWIGDAAHQDRVSDHNPDESGAVPIHDADSTDEVHAIDVDDGLKCDGDPSMEDCVQLILRRCRDGKEKRLRYIIYERRIWEADNDWRESYYGGSNPHDQHAHFSGSYESKHESDTSPWGLEQEYGMALSDGDKDWIKSTVNGLLADYVGDVVPRWTAEGGRVPDTDPNPTMTVPSALYEIGKDGAYSRYQQLGASADPAAYGQGGQPEG